MAAGLGLGLAGRRGNVAGMFTTWYLASAALTKHSTNTLVTGGGAGGKKR